MARLDCATLMPAGYSAEGLVAGLRQSSHRASTARRPSASLGKAGIIHFPSRITARQQTSLSRRFFKREARLPQPSQIPALAGDPRGA